VSRSVAFYPQKVGFNLDQQSLPAAFAQVSVGNLKRILRRDTCLAGGIAWVAAGLDGVSVFSIEDGATPEFLRTIDTPDFASGFGLTTLAKSPLPPGAVIRCTPCLQSDAWV